MSCFVFLNSVQIDVSGNEFWTKWFLINSCSERMKRTREDNKHCANNMVRLAKSIVELLKHMPSVISEINRHYRWSNLSYITNCHRQKYRLTTGLTKRIVDFKYFRTLLSIIRTTSIRETFMWTKWAAAVRLSQKRKSFIDNTWDTFSYILYRTGQKGNELEERL